MIWFEVEYRHINYFYPYFKTKVNSEIGQYSGRKKYKLLFFFCPDIFYRIHNGQQPAKNIANNSHVTAEHYHKADPPVISQEGRSDPF